MNRCLEIDLFCMMGVQGDNSIFLKLQHSVDLIANAARFAASGLALEDSPQSFKKVEEGEGEPPNLSRKVRRVRASSQNGATVFVVLEH